MQKGDRQWGQEIPSRGKTWAAPPRWERDVKSARNRNKNGRARLEHGERGKCDENEVGETGKNCQVP